MKRGFTLIELLIVITLIAFLSVLGFGAWRNQIDKARDSQKKAHLQRLKIAFEDYFNDHECYPPADILDECGGGQLKPYLDKIPCDPITKTAYTYIPDTSVPTCIRSYKIFTHLNNLTDPMIAAIGCDGRLGCGYDSTLNYGISSGNTALSTLASPVPGASAAPGASASPGASPYHFYCQGEGNCTSYDPRIKTCTPTYINNSNCDGGSPPCQGIVSVCH